MIGKTGTKMASGHTASRMFGQACRTVIGNSATRFSRNYHTPLTTLGAIGFSAMMHGYLAFDKDGNLLVPFRTWRNTMTEEASKELTELFQFNIPQRWSIAHLDQAILKNESHVKDIHFLTTLAGYVHWKLTGHKVLGVGEASGMFPFDSQTNRYDTHMIEQFNKRIEAKNLPWKLQDILPEVLAAGDAAGILTVEGARLLDPTGRLTGGYPALSARRRRRYGHGGDQLRC